MKDSYLSWFPQTAQHSEALTASLRENQCPHSLMWHDGELFLFFSQRRKPQWEILNILWACVDLLVSVHLLLTFKQEILKKRHNQGPAEPLVREDVWKNKCPSVKTAGKPSHGLEINYILITHREHRVIFCSCCISHVVIFTRLNMFYL